MSEQTTHASSPARQALTSARRIVVKVGTSALASVESGIDQSALDLIADAVAARMDRGADVVVVSSGAIGAGIAPLGLARRPRDLATKQAAASVGQLVVANAWANSFARHGRVVGQVLLSAGDFARREPHRNAQRTLDRLRGLGAIAVVNENDTVATDQIRFGDNDRLAALVAHLVGADALFLLSDVSGLFDGDPRKGPANLIPEVRDPADLAGVIAGNGGELGTGGMASKLSAACLAADAGVPVLLAAARDAGRALSAGDVGTAFAARPIRLSARKFWVRHAADARGSLVLDDGAVRAVAGRRSSLLAAGITAVHGTFYAGDVVAMTDLQGAVVARGVSAYDAAELTGLIGRSTSELPEEFRRPIVHADDLVAL